MKTGNHHVRIGRKPFVGLLATLLIFGLLAGCGPKPPSPTAPPGTLPPILITKTPQPPQLPGPQPVNGPIIKTQNNIDTSYTKDSNGSFVAGEVIITGPDQKSIDAVIGNAGLTQRISRLATIQLFSPKTALPEEVILLYGITDKRLPVLDAVKLVNFGGDPSVQADPDYLINPPVQARPWSVGTGPWGPMSSSAPADVYLHQWALTGSSGIGLGTTAPLGTGVTVGIFDTSPFSKDQVAEGAVQFIGWLDTPFNLNVSHPRHLSFSDGTTPASNHGLFVAGLVHAAAPGSTLYLVRSLNDAGGGTLYGLLTDMNAFITELKSLPGHGPLSGHTVINLSLGIQLDASAVAPVAGDSLLDCRRNSESQNIASLSCYMDWLNRSGVLVVAAAGNDSADGPRQPAEYPANYPSVIGVAATNSAGSSSCFSNTGDINAPGGDGASLSSTQPCMPALSRCPTDLTGGDCAYGLVSLMMRPSRGFAYWVGTSFSTPLVSGLAALALGTGMTPLGVQDNLLRHETTGIVDLSRTLAPPVP